jgi:hypothetical protein
MQVLLYSLGYMKHSSNICSSDVHAHWIIRINRPTCFMNRLICGPSSGLSWCQGWRMPQACVALLHYRVGLQRVDAFQRRCKRSGFCPSDLPDFDELLGKLDDRLFLKTLNNPHHILHTLMPPQSAASQHYNLRQRTHDRQLPVHRGHLLDKNFIMRLLYKDIY